MASLAQLLLECCRLQALRGFEDALRGCGFVAVAGVDEVGRGALAGPVMAGAVIVDPHAAVPAVDDSKRLDPETREKVAERVRATAVAWAVAAVSPEEIDAVNILRASITAMRLALDRLSPQPDVALVDAVRLRGLPYPCVPIIRGDQISYAVGCASILAKVERDRLMVELDRSYPMYGFATHKGYAAPEHLRALAQYGPSPLHRLTFRSVLPRLDDEAHSSRPAGPRAAERRVSAAPGLPLEGVTG